MSKFQKAKKEGAFLRMALYGPSGAGKSYTALKVATGLGGRIAAIDTERGSLSKYANLFDFDVEELYDYALQNYINLILDAQKEKYDVLVIDSLSHAWSGKGGALEMVDSVAQRMKTSNNFTAWREVTPLQNKLVDTILSSPMHVIVTMRSKTEYVMEMNDRGKNVPKKIGMAPIQRDGIEYEFDIVGDMTIENKMIIAKTRCPALTDGLFDKPGDEFVAIVKEWLGSKPADVVQTNPVKTEAVKTEPVKSNFATTSQAKELLDIALDAGHSKESFMNLLKQYKIDSAKNVPINMLETLKTIVADPKLIAKYAPKPSGE